MNDVSKETGKSAQTVYYHVNALVKLRLIVPAETRRRRSRTEQLYVRKGRNSMALTVGTSELYNRCRVRAFNLEAQRMAIENSSFWEMLEPDPEIVDYSMFRKFRLMLTPERAKKWRSDLIGILMEADEDHTPASEGGVQVRSIVYMRPGIYQLKKWAAEAGILYKILSRDGIPGELELEEDKGSLGNYMPEKWHIINQRVRR